MHLVGLGLQVLEEAFDAEPVLVPLAVPVGRAVDNPILVLGLELVPGRVARNASVFGMAHQVVLGFLPGRSLHRFDGTRAQGKFVVGNDQPVIDPDHAPEATTGLARTHGRVEGKRRRYRVGVTQVAVGAMQAGRELPDTRLGLGQRVQRVDVDTPAAAFERGLDRLQHAGAFGVGQAKAVRHHVQHLALDRASGGVGFGLGLLSVLVTIGRLGGFGGDFDLAFGLYPRITADRQPLRDFFRRGVHRQLDRKSHHQTRVFGTRKLP